MTKYTNFILTVIALLLALHLVKPWFVPSNVNAYGRATDVNIVAVGGKAVLGVDIIHRSSAGGIPVVITRNNDK